MKAALVAKYGGFDALIIDVAWSPDGRDMSVVDLSQSVTIVNLDSGSRKALLKGDDDHGGRVLHVAYLPDGKRIIHDQLAALIIYDIEGALRERQIKGFSGDDIQLRFSANGMSFAASDGGIKLFDPLTFQRMSVVKRKDVRTTAFCFSHDSRWLACGYQDGKISIWNLADHKEKLGWLAHSAPIVSLSFASCDCLVSCATGEDLRVWDVNTSALRLRTDVEFTQFRRTDASADGNLLTVEGQSRERCEWSILILDTRSYEVLCSFSDASGGVFSPSGDRVATWHVSGNEPTIRIWRINEQP